MRRQPAIWIGALTTAALLCGTQAASAQPMPRTTRMCRSQISRGVLELARTILSSTAKCQQKRSSGRLETKVECNDLAQLPDHTTVIRAVRRLASMTQRGCDAAGSPAALGYGACAAPCAAVAITNDASVAQCLSCQTESCLHDMVTSAYGTPSVSGSLAEPLTQCQNNVGRALRDYFLLKVRQQQRCQAEQDKRPTGVSCLTADERGRIATARARAQELIEAKCTDALLGGLKSCSATVAGEKTCIPALGDACADRLFVEIFPSPRPGLTPTPAPTPTPTATPTPTGSPTPSPVPSATPNTCQHRAACLMFVTSTTSGGNLGGNTGADAVCNARATAAGLGGLYQAWICGADGAPVARSLHATVPYRRTDGALIANDWTDLTDGSIANPINRDELANDLSASCPCLPWTRVRANGQCSTGTYFSPGSGPCPASSNCPRNCAFDGGANGWTSNSDFAHGAKGDFNRTDGGWTDSSSGACGTPTERIYCIEQ